MDSTARYLELHRLGREIFLTRAAPAALVRKRSDPLRSPHRPIRTLGGPGLDVPEDSTLAISADGALEMAGAVDGPGVEIYPLAKKPGAPFSDMITVGRTANNDVVLADVTISRFHAYFKSAELGEDWIVCDAGSKNGSEVEETRLEARKEIQLTSATAVRFGDVQLTFYKSAELYDYLTELKLD